MGYAALLTVLLNHPINQDKAQLHVLGIYPLTKVTLNKFC